MTEPVRAAARRNRRVRSGLRLPGNPPVIPAFFDSLESIRQQLISAQPPAPEPDTLLITADRFLNLALYSMQPPARPILVSHLPEQLPGYLMRYRIRHLIVDPVSLSLPLLVTLAKLRGAAHAHPLLRPLILVGRPQGLLSFIAASGPFTVVHRRLGPGELRQALSAPLSQPSLPHRMRMSPRLWQTVQSMSEGLSLKEISVAQSQPYHRVVYQVNRLASRLELTPRRRFLDLLHRLSLPADSAF